MLALLPAAVPDAVRGAVRWIVPRKLPLGLALLLILVIAVLAVASSKLGAQTALFGAPLHPSQAMEVERSLLVWNEPFTTDAEHTQIFVRASRKQALLLRLALAGLPHAYVPTTADVLEEQPNAFAPPAFLDDRRRAGIEGDLVAGLRRLAGVADAAVVIAPASGDSLLSGENQSAASASVQLLMQPGAALSQAQLNGVKRFVAASYPGLSADRVVVLDAGGTESTPSVVATPQHEAAALQASVQSALDAVFGAGNTVVRVTMRTAGEERTSQRTLVTPHGVLEAERGSESGTESGKRFTKEHTQTRYAYDTTVETRSAQADAPDRLSVAVFIDSAKISADQTPQVAQVVRAAAGADLQKDQVVVAAVPFSSPVQRAPDDRRSLRALAPAGAVVAALIACWSAIAARRPPRPTPDDRAAAELHASLRHEMPQTAAYVLGGLPLALRDRVLRAYLPEQRELIVSWMNARTPGA